MRRLSDSSAEAVLITSNGAILKVREFYVNLYCVAFHVSRIPRNTSAHRRFFTLLKPCFPMLAHGAPTTRRLSIDRNGGVIGKVVRAVLLALILVAATYFLEILVDNATSRLTWRWMLGYVWSVGLGMSLINIIWLYAK